jgi:hypothetical protein
MNSWGGVCNPHPDVFYLYPGMPGCCLKGTSCVATADYLTAWGSLCCCQTLTWVSGLLLLWFLTNMHTRLLLLA